MGARDTFPRFVPRPPWLTGDLQTLRNILRRPFHDLSPWREERVEVPLDEAGGDRLLAHIHTPQEKPRAVTVLIHGLSGCADSVYVRATALHLLQQGHAVIRLNLRGAAATSAPVHSLYHAGRSGDLRAAFVALRRRENIADLPWFAVGYSLGGNMLLKYLAEEGKGTALAAAVAVSVPLDLAACSARLRLRRNRVYEQYLISRLRADTLARVTGLTGAERHAVESSGSVLEYDERFVAPRNGFAGAADYYAKSSSDRYLGGIATPTLVVHGMDDPWIPAEVYRRVPWNDMPLLQPLLPNGGGHVGFHAIDSRTPWHDRCLGVFLDRFTGTAAER